MQIDLPEPTDPEGSTKEWREAYAAQLKEVSDYNHELRLRAKRASELLIDIRGIIISVNKTDIKEVYSDIPPKILEELIPDYSGEPVISELELMIKSSSPVRRIIPIRTADYKIGNRLDITIFAGQIERMRPYSGGLCRLQEKDMSYVVVKRPVRDTEVALVVKPVYPYCSLR